MTNIFIGRFSYGIFSYSITNFISNRRLVQKQEVTSQKNTPTHILNRCFIEVI